VFSHSQIYATVQITDENKVSAKTLNETHIQYNKNCRMNTFLYLFATNRLSQGAGPSKKITNTQYFMQKQHKCNLLNKDLQLLMTDQKNKKYYSTLQ